MGPHSDRTTLLLLRKVVETINHNLEALRGLTFAKDVTYMTQKVGPKVRCIQYVLVDQYGAIVSTNGSNKLQSPDVAKKLADGNEVIAHVFVLVDESSRQQEYLCKSGEESNRFKSKVWSNLQENILRITTKEATSVGEFNKLFYDLLKIRK